VTTTTGGGNATPVTVTTLSALNTQAAGTTARVIYVQGTISGDVTVGSNKTIAGVCGGQIHGHIEINGSTNVIVRNLTIVGYNCTDNPSDCSGGADAISVRHQAHHIWFDHCDISDGSDGNLDISNGADFVTVSWTKFHYTGRTDPANSQGHMFSNLVGGSDSNGSEDSGHLNVTWHHNWWATNVRERMPRVRFGKNHIFNNLWTASGNSVCIALGVSANIRDENNVFVGVNDPVNTADYSDSASVITSSGNIYTNTSGQIGANIGTAFTPSYSYTLDAASGVQSAVQSGAGPK
jgi:pectate lyase